MTSSPPRPSAARLQVARPRGNETSLGGWSVVQHAVHDAAKTRSPLEARVEISRALNELTSAGAPTDHSIDTSTDSGHLAAQRSVLLDLLTILTLDSVPGPGPAAAGAELCDVLAGAGADDVVCVLRLVGGDERAALALPELQRHAEAVVRTTDHVRALDERDLVVVLARIPLPVAWRRMSTLVGYPPRRGDASTPSSVWAGIARVGGAGGDVALGAARTALAHAVAGADPVTTRGRVALAPDRATARAR